ncbi:MAG: hypothetical protein MZU95_03710 [Desulfomicrobium escambiense]|nr:hypothetical protein [Desulfomicrobium escambiense]
MIPSRIIETKRDGGVLAQADLQSFLDGYLQGAIPDYQMAAFLMATYFRGLHPDEAEVLVRAMVGSGSVLDLSWLDGPRVDKHSTGGVGDKVSLALAPLAAALRAVRSDDVGAGPRPHHAARWTSWRRSPGSAPS